ETFEDAARVGRVGGALHPGRDPLGDGAVAQVHELDADRAAVDPAPAIGLRAAGALEILVDERDEPSERIEVRLQVPPTSKRIGERAVAGHDGASFPVLSGTVRGRYVTPARGPHAPRVGSAAARYNPFLMIRSQVIH